MCLHPWTNIDIQLDGNIMPCCKWPANFPGEKFNIHTANGITDYKNSKLLKELKQSLLDHQWHPGCYRCQLDESRGILSKRLHDAPILEKKLGAVDLDRQDILTVATELGIECNLACVICGPIKSTAWQKYLAKQTQYPINFINPVNKVTDRVNVVKTFNNIRHFELHGGDPLMTNLVEHQEILDHFINQNLAGEMSLKYHTNGTIWPSKKLVERWKKFQQVELCLSIDGVGSVFEYQRWPGKWLKTEKNIKRIQSLTAINPNITVTIQASVSAYNIFFLPELSEWAVRSNISNLWITEVIYPDHMQPAVWPMSAREQIFQKLSQSDNVYVRQFVDHVMSAEYSEQLFLNFVKRSFEFDQARGTSSRDFLKFEVFQTEYQKCIDKKWQNFYNNIKDSTWPECESAAVAKQILPKHILDEIILLHKGWLDD